jgi:hypothetical protein
MERHTLKKNNMRRSCAVLDWSPLSFLTFLLSKEETQCGARTSVLSQYVTFKFRIVGGLTSSSGRQQDFSNSDTTLLLNSFHCLALSKKT